ncbi:MAG TPA: 23S rRNA (uracil(1939)-C(5))-methyltransferase RlmD [Cyclobacteriaceae bacterium]|nr:23S rRNA (uracil(1939)-C(5))-methyltransferase RlmD [Cyclobacteriaceae bacterium]
MDKVKRKIVKNVLIRDFAAEAKCVTRINNQVVFVENVAPGDIVDLEVLRKKKNFLEGRALRVIKYSKKRDEPFCEHFGTCGGCRWQHIGYEHQLEFKRHEVIDAFQRIGKLEFPEVKPTLGSGQGKFYRNKLEFTFTSRRWLSKKEIESGQPVDRNGLGFHKAREFDKVINIRNCYLQPEPSNTIRNSLREFALEHKITFFDVQENTGFLRTMIIRTSNTGEVMVILQVTERDTRLITLLMNFLYENFPIIKSLNYVVNNKPNDTFLDLEVVTFSGKPYITERMGDLMFRISPKSFYQTNSEQAHRLYKVMKEKADPGKDDIVYDLYTGAGTIAVYLAGSVKKVIGVESVEQAVEDAKINAAINNITNVSFFCGDVKDILSKDFFEKNGRPGLVVTDPPRAGMHERVVEALLRVRPARIIYISCNPATQARDIALMKEKYVVAAVQPVDMFPHTHHIENIVLLTERKA